MGNNSLQSLVDSGVRLTPMMEQYHSIKKEYPDTLLLYRMGDFYELFFDDAVTAARELEITLTSRSKDKDIPMCGVPFHSAESYIAKLIQRGFRVAVCEQMEDPKVAKKLVKREITRIVTPGTATASNVLRQKENNYLAAVTFHRNQAGLTHAGLAHADLSTGEFRATETTSDELPGLLESLNVREILIPEGASTSLPVLHTALEPWVFETDYASRLLREHFRLLSLDGCGLADRHLAASAAGALVHYLRDTQRSALTHLERPGFYDRSSNMVLDAITVRNLELVEPLLAGERRDAVVVDTLDHTRTSMGARLLRQRLLRPLLDRDAIEHRLDEVDQLRRDTILRTALRDQLDGILDLERLLARTSLGQAGPRDLLALGRSLARVPELRSRLRGLPSLATIEANLDDVPEAAHAILSQIADDPPAQLADGGAIRDGVDPRLDELRDLSRNSKQYLAGIEQRERDRTGIASLKIRFNHVFGYYIEISKANLKLAPADYERKQTLVGAERFTTPELKDLESKILEAEARILDLEREHFQAIREAVLAHASRIKAAAAAIAALDVTAALAQAAAENRYTRPRFHDSGTIRVLAGRHPVIEQLLEQDAQRFIPNDLQLDSSGKFIGVITGPNMGGKSTYLRQAALYSILAQTGSFVPADEALLPIVDRVFTRIGAADNLARGRSTFMVEMTEIAIILNTATPRSLIVLDEIGRGTSTYDGLSLAWAVIEYIHDRIGALTLCATHYHELTELEDRLQGVINLHVSVKESNGNILFLRRVEPGRADRSYGIEVARLAALPAAVIERAREVLSIHEDYERRAVTTIAPQDEPPGPMQISLFEPVNHAIAEKIRRLNLEQLRPIEALNLLAELQQELRS